MASSYPSTNDNLTNPTASDKTNSVTVPHASQHANANDAIEAIEAKLGYSSSTAAGIATPSTNTGDVFYVSDSLGHTRYGPYAMVPLARSALTSTAGSITFNSIPNTFRGLELEVSARTDGAVTFTGLLLRWNADAGANYHYQTIAGTGATVTAAETGGAAFEQIGEIPGASSTGTSFGATSYRISNYASTGRKASVSHSAAEIQGSTNNMVNEVAAQVWNSTAPCTGLQIFPGSGGFTAGTVATLYGLPQ